jgi:uncharacterized protein
MKWAESLVALLLVTGLGVPDSWAADDRPIVAVFEIQTKLMKLPQAERDIMTSLLVEELAIGGAFKVMPPGDVKKILIEQSKESYKKCYDESCQIQLGRRLPANKLLTSSVMKLGKKCRVSISLYDLKQQTADTTEKVRGGCSQDALLESIVVVAGKLRNWAAGTVSDVTLPTEDTVDKPGQTDDKKYKRALNQAWRKLAKVVRKGTTEQKLEKYQEFLTDFPTDNPYVAKVQKNIDILDARLAKQEEARRRAAEKKAALEAKLKRSKELKAAYNAAKAAQGTAGAQLALWEKFVSDYPDNNPYLKTAKRQIRKLREQKKKEPGIMDVTSDSKELRKEVAGLHLKATMLKKKRPEEAVALCKKAMSMIKTSDLFYGKCRELIAKIRKTGGSTGSAEKRQVIKSLPAVTCSSAKDCWVKGGTANVGKKHGQAVSYYLKACDLGENRGCTYAAAYFKSGNSIKKDEVRAIGLYKKACDRKGMEGCLGAGSLYKGKKDYVNSVMYFRQACNLGNDMSCSKIGYWYKQGRYLPKDPSKAAKFLAKACMMRTSRAFECIDVGKMFLDGYGVKKDISKAKKYLKRACIKMTSQEACTVLKRL